MVVEDQIYRDKMFGVDVKVTGVTDEVVFVRDTELLEELSDEGGNAYWRNREWRMAVKHGRFELKEDVEGKDEHSIFSH
jgi:hypothetical protein